MPTGAQLQGPLPCGLEVAEGASAIVVCGMLVSLTQRLCQHPVHCEALINRLVGAMNEVSNRRFIPTFKIGACRQD